MNRRQLGKAILVWGMLSSSGLAQEISPLQFRVFPGRKTYYESAWERTADVRALQAGEEREQPMTVRTVMTYSIKDVDIQGSGLGSLEFTLLALRKSASGGSITVSYDSRDPHSADTAIGQAFASLLDKPFQVVIGQNGRAVRFSGLDELLEEAAQKAPANLREAVYEVLAAPVVEHRYGAYLVAQAPTPLRADSTWRAEYLYPLDARRLVGTDLTCRIEAVPEQTAGSLVRLRYDGQLELRSAQEVPDDAEVSIDFREGSVEGTATWDTYEGQLAAADWHQMSEVIAESRSRPLTQVIRDEFTVSVRRVTPAQVKQAVGAVRGTTSRPAKLPATPKDTEPHPVPVEKHHPRG